MKKSTERLLRDMNGVKDMSYDEFENYIDNSILSIPKDRELRIGWNMIEILKDIEIILRSYGNVKYAKAIHRLNYLLTDRKYKLESDSYPSNGRYL